MSQHDFDVGNQTAPAFRTDLNNALQALASLSSGATAPSSTFANMLWYDTTNNILKMRAEADDAWINIAYLDQSFDAFRILDDTQVVNTSGTQTGLLGDQSTATWETGTGTTESLVSPAKVKAAIDALGGWGFTSSEQSITLSSKITVAHGLGAVPVEFDAYLVCKTAQSPYLVDEVVLAPAQVQVGGAGYNIALSADATNVYARVGAQISLLNDTGALLNLTAASWRLVVRARV